MDPIPFLENCAGMNERFREVAYDVAYGKPCHQCGSRDGSGMINHIMETTIPCQTCATYSAKNRNDAADMVGAV